MSYCTNCGQQLSDGVKFCSECGAPVGSGSTGEYKNREQVYVGVVKKCPVCGEELPSMAAVCPSCGHEINSTQVHSALQKFIDELDFCDRSIADDEALLAITGEKESERGWRSWSTVAKVLWVIVNCLALCVPLVVYYLLRSRQSHRFAPSVKRKANLIENFQIPSERQAILESQTSHIGAFQVEKQAEVGIAGAEALGHMSDSGAGSVSLGGDSVGFNPAAMMAGMAVGGAVGQNIAGTMNSMMAGVNRPIQTGVTPPPIPVVAYHVAINGQVMGPYDINTLAQMASAGQFNADSLVWKAGKLEWWSG